MLDIIETVTKVLVFSVILLTQSSLIQVIDGEHLIPETVVVFNSHWSSLTGAQQSQFVTCGSVIKLLNEAYKVRLHSHDVKYGGKYYLCK